MNFTSEISQARTVNPSNIAPQSYTTLIVVAHAPLASAFLAVVAHVHGALPSEIVAVDVPANEPKSATQSRIATLIAAAPHGALVLSDMPGATPHNCAAQVCNSVSLPRLAETISPLSAPLLLRAVNYRHLSPTALVAKLSA